APLITLSALTRHRLENEALVYRAAEARLPTQLAGELRTFVYRSRLHHGEHLALVKGEIAPDKPVLTRVQPEFTFADVFGGDNPPSRAQIKRSLQAIGERECGVFVYLRRASEGQLSSQISRWEQRFNEKPASMMREYGLGAQILRDLGVRKVELLTGSKKNLVGLKTFGIEIVSQLPLPL
ncbi:MAG: bifunctional 3,4-dihydroxy-2-butanone-4-phosphate synthase/GTP cyclohydrolase II, partial [Proteobacteria bacterium]